jgi:hypothetical protein
MKKIIFLLLLIFGTANIQAQQISRLKALKYALITGWTLGLINSNINEMLGKESEWCLPFYFLNVHLETYNVPTGQSSVSSAPLPIPKGIQLNLPPLASFLYITILTYFACRNEQIRLAIKKDIQRLLDNSETMQELLKSPYTGKLIRTAYRIIS